MPDFNETTVAQSFINSSPHSKDNCRERYPPRSKMPKFNETTVAQSFVDSSPRSKDNSRKRYPPESKMPNINETTVAQSFVDSSPRSKDSSRERYPLSSREEFYIRRRRSPQKHRSSPPRPAIVYAPSVPSGHTSSDSSASPKEHHVRFDQGQHDTHYSSKVLTERRIIRRHEADRRDLDIVPVSNVRDAYARRGSHERRYTHDYDSDSDSGSDAYHSSDEERRKQEKLRNKKLLYVGLACVTTIAAGNNIYQSTKAHHARRRYVEQGQMSEAEAMKLRKKALILDVLSVGVAAVGVNNVRMGWNRVQSMR